MRAVILLGAAFIVGCAGGENAPSGGVPSFDSSVTEVSDTDVDTGVLAIDAPETSAETKFDEDAACATATAVAKTEVLPVDIIWMVDNSASMEPAVTEIKAGLNSFASLIAAKMLDYKVIMLALRSKTSPITLSGSTRYPVCIPPPLAGDDNCGNGPRFFHAAVDIKSTQPLEQFLGTLDQTEGYKVGQDRGSEPWKEQLRPTATRTIVVVTDDNSRLSATDFETFAGGKNPFNSLILPPGILDPSRKDMFKGYVFAGLYGWDSATDPSAKCKYADGTSPPASGATYTTLVTKTGGPRAKICDGKAAWGPFFDAIATAVAKTAKLACEIDIPMPSTGTLDPSAVNVKINGMIVPQTKTCGDGWHYDNEAAPTKVILCGKACDDLNASMDRKMEVLFGCKTVIK